MLASALQSVRNFDRRSRLIMTLAALLAVTTGAWAQGPTVWTTEVSIEKLNEGDILAEGSSLTSDNLKDDVIFIGGRQKMNGKLMTNDEHIPVYHISSFGENCVISGESNTYAPVDEFGDDGNAWIVTDWVDNGDYSYSVCLSGIYYDPNGVALTANDNRTVWTIDKMPAADVELTVRYYDDAEVSGPATAATGVRVGENKALVSGLSTEHGTLVYAITAATVTTAPADNQFAAANNTAKDLTTEGTYRVWYYVDPDNTHSPSDPKSVDVEVLTNKFDITFTAANTNTIDGTKATVSVKDGETDPVDMTDQIANGVLAGVTMGQTVILTAAEGYKIVSASDGRTVYRSQVAMADLQVGDILANGFSLTGDDNDNILFNADRYKWGGALQTIDGGRHREDISSFGENGVITSTGDITFAPVDENNQVGNAWVVTKVIIGTPTAIYLSGITYTPLVSLNAAKTEATLTMPACDVALSYDLRRDLSTGTAVTVSIGGEQATTDTRLRIAKDGNGNYKPVKNLTCSFADTKENVTISDAKDILDAGLNPQFYLLGDNNTWTLVTDISATTHLPTNIAPGQTYQMTLAALDASIYTGETPRTVSITLYEGYEVSVPAQEYITYFKDEALTLGADETAAKLYTITAVDGQTATATEVTVAKDNMPILVKNNSTETRNILLIPTTDNADDVDNYEGFKGTLAAKTFSDDDMNGKQYYVLAGGKMFARVSGAGTIAANRCWLELDNAKAARQLNIHIGDETTGVEELKDSGIEELNSDAWYDLQGRKLDGQPTRKGMYIHGSKKIIIRTNNQ